jgi:hypothetical protein
VNRSGNRPQRERTPPVKRIADPENLEAENPAIKAAAEIKAEEDLAPQKIKALKYLATVGCGCYDKDGKIEEALLAALSDCTEEVRIEAANAVRTAAGTCRCTYDGCTPTCCKPSIVKRLDEMAYGVDDDGCHIEPSREVRAAAARARSACSAVPQTPEPVAETPEEDPPQDEPKKGGEQLPPPTDEPALNSPESLPPPGADSVRSRPQQSVELVGAISPTSSSLPAVLHEVPENFKAPENMVIARITRHIGDGRALLRLDTEYDLQSGDSLLVLTLDGNSFVATILAVNGDLIEVGAEASNRFHVPSSPVVFLGLIAG